MLIESGGPSRPLDLGSLNPQQLAAVTHGGGPLLIFAGAGSGKTRVLTMRIAHLLRARGVGAERVLALTFTNRAAREIRSRLTQLLGAQKGLWVGTFHSIAVRMLRPHAELLGYRPGFAIYDEEDSRALLKRTLTDLQL
ncbi:MAG: UvrD-helicase domain-containing protein, partial [Candidatus Dormibacteraceae bacterium]